MCASAQTPLAPEHKVATLAEGGRPFLSFRCSKMGLVMTYELIAVAQCADLCGLGPNEIVLGVTPSRMHNSLYESYMLHRAKGWEAVRDMIVADIRMALDLGAKKRAADLLIVLRRFLSEPRGAELQREAGEVVSVRFRSNASRMSDARRTRSQASVVERLCSMRREAGRLRSAPLDGNVLFLDFARRRRLAAGRGDR